MPYYTLKSNPDDCDPIIEAFQLKGDGPTAAPDWFTPDKKDVFDNGIMVRGLLHGHAFAPWGYWVVRNKYRKLEICDPKTFERAYEFISSDGVDCKFPI